MLYFNKNSSLIIFLLLKDFYNIFEILYIRYIWVKFAYFFDTGTIGFPGIPVQLASRSGKGLGGLMGLISCIMPLICSMMRW